MKSVFFIAITLLFNTLICFAQEKPDVPVNAETGMVEYIEVVTIDGSTSPEELYNRLNHWFNSYYKNPSNIIKGKEENKSIKGQHYININNKIKNAQQRVGMVKYRIDVGVKEGKYRYKIHDIFFVSSPKKYVQDWLDDNDKLKEHNFKYLGQVDTFIKDVISNLKTTMAKPVPGAATDDW